LLVTVIGFSFGGRASLAPVNRMIAPNLAPNLAPRAQSLVNGARVLSVDANSPAEKAGLKVGDVVTAVGGTKIDATHSLADLIQAKKPGDKVELTVTRDSQTLTITVELGASSTNASAAYLGVRYGAAAPAPTFRRRSGFSGDLPNG
jgi:S1-C subfamily serine protease